MCGSDAYPPVSRMTTHCGLRRNVPTSFLYNQARIIRAVISRASREKATAQMPKKRGTHYSFRFVSTSINIRQHGSV